MLPSLISLEGEFRTSENLYQSFVMSVSEGPLMPRPF